MIENVEDFHERRNAHEQPFIVNRIQVGASPMIDTLSLLLAHFLLGFVAIKLLLHPDLNEEPTQSGRHFKQVLPKKQQAKKRAGVETGESRPGSNRA
ncbi:hypothetical protein [Sphingomonas sp. SRS2]|uniref:hypothetical protein n=1 Tax=Sphingomonas sp. SRS2 TaxID=133190 RepID=UPI00128E4750|nr:hypothetical protein [Sphingomonas sp. SRS2]